MADKWIRGKNVSVYLITGSPPDAELIGCARTCTRNTVVEIAPKSTLGSGLFKEFKGISNSWNVSVEGLCTVDVNMDMQTLTDIQFALDPVLVSWEEVSTSGTVVYVGYGIITNISVTGNYADAETYNVQIQGTGVLVSGSGNIFGNPPGGFYLASDVPNISAGTDTLGFRWSSANPAPDSYTMEINDLTTVTTTYDTGITTLGHSVDVLSTHTYSFRVKSVYNGVGDSNYSPYLFWP